jgi:hypothetical protein
MGRRVQARAASEWIGVITGPREGVVRRARGRVLVSDM